jgi:glycosyltransferase involved in cell wall biosynthesis
MKKKIFLLYPYYWPFYKAGGPVQSLFNLAATFKGNVEFYFISLEKDIDGTISEVPIKMNKWVLGPNEENIFYVRSISLSLVFKLIRTISPDIIFVNGMFNIQTTLPGMIWAKWFGIRLIISPRGMLQRWALQRNPWVKKIALLFFKMILQKNEWWHATDIQEKNDIIWHFGEKQNVFIATNIPRKVSSYLPMEYPKNGAIKLVYLSLINSNKNLHLIIDAVNELGKPYLLDIYGPVADQEYWESCKKKIAINSPIQYKGAVRPWDIPLILQEYHFFVLPTTGENFGHAIFDSLSCGVPVLISRTTPWQDIERSKAGYYIDPLNSASLIIILKKVSEMNAEEYEAYRMNSHKYATQYWNTSTFNEDYGFLIDSN